MPRKIDRFQLVRQMGTWLAPGVIAFLIAMAIAFTRWPQPHMHDDFGNMLVAQTLLQGRFANPVPAAWESFETFHVIFQPSYASKYPIGLGVLLAIGEMLFSQLACGLWISAAIATSSVSWMVAGCCSKRIAFATGILVATHPYWQNGWSQEYTNGWLGVAGVSMVLGGMIRIARLRLLGDNDSVFARVPFAMIGIGAVIILGSRPYEGGVVCLLVGIWTLCKLVNPRRRTRTVENTRFWLDATISIAIVAVSLVGQMWINRSITGKWSQLPYQLHEQQYGVAPVLIFQKPHEPTIGHRFEELSRFHRGWSMDAYQRCASVSGYCQMLLTRLQFTWNHWGNALIFLPFVGLLFQPTRRLTVELGIVFLLGLLTINLVPWAVPHYVSPLIPIAIIAAVRSMRYACLATSRSLPSTLSHRSLELFVFSILLIGNVSQLYAISKARANFEPGWEETWAERRSAIVQKLSQSGEDHLILVRYPVEHDIVNSEWVFNGADIPRSKVLWARFGETELNDRLQQQYPSRKTWLLTFDPEGVEALHPMNESTNR